MKRKIVLFLCFIIGISFTGCGKQLKSMDGNYMNQNSTQSIGDMKIEMTDMSSPEAGLTIQEEQEFNTEEYSSINENRFLSVKNQPLSTFSADVDTASYANVRRLLKDQRSIDPGAVRIEEMINYFHYDYDAPKGDEPFSISTELADCPWNLDTKLLSIGIRAKEFSKEELENKSLYEIPKPKG